MHGRLASELAAQVGDTLFEGAEHMLQPDQRSMKEFRILLLSSWHCLIILLCARLSSLIP